jgi:hypothetical protein
MNVINQVVTDRYALYNGDCCEVVKSIPDETIGYTMFSPPFSSLFTYSNSPRDMGNSRSDAEFYEHFGFLVRDLFRITIKGRLVSIHCMQIPAMKERDGFIGIKDFRGDLIRLFESEGFIFHSEVLIWKDPLIEATRTKALGLMHKQLCKDSTKCRSGLPDYIITMRKPGENPIPVKHKDGLSAYHGEKELEDGVRSHNIWRRYASPVWMDIRQTHTLNKDAARGEQDERHICLAKDSMVLTKNGHKKIQDVEINDLVLTHMGRWRKVLAKQMTGVNDTINIFAQGVCGLRLTPNHKLWAKDSNGTAHPKHTAVKNDPAWIDAKDLKQKYINLKLPDIEEDKTGLSNLEWYLVGRWIADGHIDLRNVAHISCGYQKFDYLTEKCGHLLGNPRMNRTAAQIPIKDPGLRIRNVLYRCGKGSVNKKIPPEAFTLDNGKAESLLSGYLSGDGYLLQNRNRWMACSVSKELLLGLQFLILRVYGVISSIHKGRPERKCSIEGRIVNSKQEWNLSFQTSGYGFGFVNGDGAWKRVRLIEQSEPCETWNLRVEEDESYTAEGCIVKNCPLQIDTVERCQELWSTKDDIVFEPFGGIGTVPYVAVKNGRKAIAVELKESYFNQMVKNVESVNAPKQIGLV